MKYLVAFLVFLICGLWIGELTRAGAQTTVCRKGAVRYEGGAIACPTCKSLANAYVPDPKYNDEVKGHMKKAMADDLDSAKWLIAYFSDQTHKDYAEAKKWFGRALGIGANGVDVQLPGGYDVPYMTTALLENEFMKALVSSSCMGVNDNWQPKCYSQFIKFQFDQNGKTDTRAILLGNIDFKVNTVVLTLIKYYQMIDGYFLVFESSGRNGEYSRKDYFSQDGYLGSSNDKSELFYTNFKYGEASSQNYKALPLIQQKKIQKKLENQAVNCIEYGISLYPVSGLRVEYENYK